MKLEETTNASTNDIQQEASQESTAKYDFRKVLKKIRDTGAVEGFGEMTLKYLPFILTKAKKKYLQCNMKFTYDELLDEALLAALTAEKRYNKDLGYDFTTYAQYDIDGALSTYTSSLSNTQLVLFRKLSKFIDNYAADTGKHPSKESIIKGLKISEEKYTHLVQDLVPPMVLPYMSIQEDGDETELGIQEDMTDGEILINDILKIIENLEPELKSIIEMSVIQELSIDSIATYLKVPKAVAQGRIDTAKVELRDILALHDITEGNF